MYKMYHRNKYIMLTCLSLLSYQVSPLSIFKTCASYGIFHTWSVQISCSLQKVHLWSVLISCSFQEVHPWSALISCSLQEVHPWSALISCSFQEVHLWSVLISCSLQEVHLVCTDLLFFTRSPSGLH